MGFAEVVGGNTGPRRSRRSVNLYMHLERRLLLGDVVPMVRHLLCRHLDRPVKVRDAGSTPAGSMNFLMLVCLQQSKGLIGVADTPIEVRP